MRLDTAYMWASQLMTLFLLGSCLSKLADHETNIMPCVDVIEAHCYFVDIGQTDREQIRSRINNNAGRFSHIGLCQLVLYAVQRPFTLTISY